MTTIKDNILAQEAEGLDLCCMKEVYADLGVKRVYSRVLGLHHIKGTNLITRISNNVATTKIKRCIASHQKRLMVADILFLFNKPTKRCEIESKASSYRIKDKMNDAEKNAFNYPLAKLVLVNGLVYCLNVSSV